MRWFAFVVGFSTAFAAASPLSAAGHECEAQPLEVTIPTRNVSGETARALQDRLQLIEGVTDVAVPDDRIEFTIAPGRTVRLSFIREALEEVRADNRDAQIELPALTLRGEVQVCVELLGQESQDWAVGALQGVRGVARVQSPGPGCFVLTIEEAAGVTVRALNEALAADPHRQGDPARVHDVHWTAPEPPSEEPCCDS